MNAAEALKEVQRELPMAVELATPAKHGASTVYPVKFSGRVADISLPMIVESSGTARIVMALTPEWFSLLKLFAA